MNNKRERRSVTKNGISANVETSICSVIRKLPMYQLNKASKKVKNTKYL